MTPKPFDPPEAQLRRLVRLVREMLPKVTASCLPDVNGNEIRTCMFCLNSPCVGGCIVGKVSAAVADEPEEEG